MTDEAQVEMKKHNAICNPINNPINHPINNPITNPLNTAKRKAERDVENRRLIAADPARAAHLLTPAELDAIALDLWEVRQYPELEIC